MKGPILFVISMIFVFFAMPAFAEVAPAVADSTDGIFAFIKGLADQYQIVFYILSGLGALVVLGTAYIVISPTKKDDAWLQKVEQHAIFGFLLRLIKRFAPIGRIGE